MNFGVLLEELQDLLQPFVEDFPNKFFSFPQKSLNPVQPGLFQTVPDPGGGKNAPPWIFGFGTSHDTVSYVVESPVYI